MMLLALVVHIGNMAKIGIRDGYSDKYENQRPLRQVQHHLKGEQKWNLNDPSRLSLEDPSKYVLSLSGKLEPESHLATVNLSEGSPSSRARRVARQIGRPTRCCV